MSLLPDPLERSTLDIQMKTRNVALETAGASAELTSLLLDILEDPGALVLGGSAELTRRFLALNEGVQELQGLAASLSLLKAVDS